MRNHKAPIVGSVRNGGSGDNREWSGCHVLQRSAPGWYEYRIDYSDGSSESGVAQDKDVQVGEHPDALEAIGEPTKQEMCEYLADLDF